MVADVLIFPWFLWQRRLKVRNIIEFFLLAQTLELWNFETEVKLDMAVGTFLLTNLLLDTLKATAQETGEEGRIVNVASEAHRYAYKGGIVFDKLNDEKR